MNEVVSAVLDAAHVELMLDLSTHLIDSSCSS